MSFRAVSSNPDAWKALADALAGLVEEASFEVSPEGISLRAMDPSRVAMVSLSWMGASFEEYSCGSSTTISIRIDDLRKVMKRADKKDRITIELGEGNLTFRLKDGYDREFVVPLVEAGEALRPLPKLSFNAQAKILQRSLKKVLEDVESVSDHVTLKAQQDSLEFYGRSELGQVRARITKNDPDLLEMLVKEPSEATYSLEYLSDFVKSVKPAEVSTLEFSSKMPIKLAFPLDERGSVMEFYLAPRVE
ncbi:MAG: proliferating cell nuclear antigen (pcna) [Nitrososphaeria archaeon]